MYFILILNVDANYPSKIKPPLGTAELEMHRGEFACTSGTRIKATYQRPIYMNQLVIYNKVSYATRIFGSRPQENTAPNIIKKYQIRFRVRNFNSPVSEKKLRVVKLIISS